MTAVGGPVVPTPVPWVGVIAIEGETTVDGRFVVPGALDWGHGSMPVIAVNRGNVGMVLDIWRQEFDRRAFIWARGLIDPAAIDWQARTVPCGVDMTNVDVEEWRDALFAVARQKMCRRGHDLTDAANVHSRPDGRRRCRVCQIEGQRERRRRQRSKL